MCACYGLLLDFWCIYGACLLTGTIPVMEGQMEVTLPEGGNVRYEVEVPDMGVTTRVCVHDGTVILFASYTVTNPNSAFHDFSFEVGSNGTTTCDDVFIPPESASRRRRQSVENATTTLFVSLVGVEEENEFEFQTVEGDTTDRSNHYSSMNNSGVGSLFYS